MSNAYSFTITFTMVQFVTLPSPATLQKLRQPSRLSETPLTCHTTSWCLPVAAQEVKQGEEELRRLYTATFPLYRPTTTYTVHNAMQSQFRLSTHHIRMSWVDIKRDYARSCLANIFRIRGILQRKYTDVSHTQIVVETKRTYKFKFKYQNILICI